MDKESTPEWASKVPFDVRDGAVRDFDKARRAQFAKQKLASRNAQDPYQLGKHTADIGLR